MARALLPFYVHASQPARELLGVHLEKAAIAAIRAVIKNQRGVEIAFQQINYAGRCLALSSRVTRAGDIVIDLDIGNPALDGHVILETEMIRAERKARENERAERDASRMLNRRRW